MFYLFFGGAGSRLSVTKYCENGAIVSFPVPHHFLFFETEINTAAHVKGFRRN